MKSNNAVRNNWADQVTRVYPFNFKPHLAFLLPLGWEVESHRRDPASWSQHMRVGAHGWLPVLSTLIHAIKARMNSGPCNESAACQSFLSLRPRDWGAHGGFPLNSETWFLWGLSLCPERWAVCVCFCVPVTQHCCSVCVISSVGMDLPRAELPTTLTKRGCFPLAIECMIAV